MKPLLLLALSMTMMGTAQTKPAVPPVPSDEIQRCECERIGGDYNAYGCDAIGSPEHQEKMREKNPPCSFGMSLSAPQTKPLPKICGTNHNEQCVAGGVPKPDAKQVTPHTLVLVPASPDLSARPQGNFDMGNPTGYVDVYSSAGRIVKLSDNEYTRLRNLRQAVTDAEMEIAKAHGVDVKGDMNPCADQTITSSGCGIYPEWKPRYPDSYEFRGQFLLVNVPQAGTKPEAECVVRVPELEGQVASWISRNEATQ
jgi:hypothetical protein